MLQIFVDFSALVEARVHKSQRDSSARERAPFRVIVAPLFRDAMIHTMLIFFCVRFTLFQVLLWTLKQLRAYDPWSPWPEEEIESKGAARTSKTSLPQQWRTPILKRSNEDLPSLSHLSAGRGPKTYNKYLMGVILVGALPLRTLAPGPIMIFAVLSRCRICLQITTREMVTQSLLSFAPLLLPFVSLPSLQNMLLSLAHTLVLRSSPSYPSSPFSFRVSTIQSGLHYFVVRPRPRRIILNI